MDKENKHGGKRKEGSKINGGSETSRIKCSSGSLTASWPPLFSQYFCFRIPFSRWIPKEPTSPPSIAGRPLERSKGAAASGRNAGLPASKSRPASGHRIARSKSRPGASARSRSRSGSKKKSTGSKPVVRKCKKIGAWTPYQVYFAKGMSNSILSKKNVAALMKTFKAAARSDWAEMSEVEKAEYKRTADERNRYLKRRG